MVTPPSAPLGGAHGELVWRKGGSWKACSLLTLDDVPILSQPGSAASHGQLMLVSDKREDLCVPSESRHQRRPTSWKRLLAIVEYMAPEKRNERRKSPRHEYEVAYSTKELGRPLQRQLLQRRFDEMNDGNTAAASSHCDEPSREPEAAPPREDRAG